MEDRRVLRASISEVSSPYDDFRFLAGSGLDPVWNTYTAWTEGEATRVEFHLGGQTVEDNDPTDGWTGAFDMSSLGSATELVVRAYAGTTLVDEYTHDVVKLLRMPNWFYDSGDTYSTGTQFDATWLGWDSGYQFDVTVNHFDVGVQHTVRLGLPRTRHPGTPV